MDYIAGHWKQFFDPHSGIAFYRVGLGSQPYTDDVEPLTNVGLRTGMNDVVTNINEPNQYELLKH